MDRSTSRPAISEERGCFRSSSTGGSRRPRRNRGDPSAPRPRPRAARGGRGAPGGEALALRRRRRSFALLSLAKVGDGSERSRRGSRDRPHRPMARRALDRSALRRSFPGRSTRSTTSRSWRSSSGTDGKPSLTGDAGASTEDALLGSGRDLRADLLKVAHHGSRTSTTPPFLDAVHPRLAILSCGRENRFGHPAPETLATLASRRVPVFRTDRLSDVRVELAPEATRLAWRGLE